MEWEWVYELAITNHETKHTIILEFKVQNNRKESTLEDIVAVALKQIEEK